MNIKSDERDKWVIVESKSGYHEDGYPLGQILCRDGDYKSVIKEHGILDPIVKKYIKDATL